MISFLTIRLESRAPCKNEVKRRLRTKDLRWRRRDHAWWHATRGVRKSLHKVWDLVNPENTDERKEVVMSGWKQHAIRFKIRNRMLSSKSTRDCSSSSWKQHAGGSNSKHTVKRERKHSNSNSTRRLVAPTPELRNMEYTNHQYMSKIFQFLQNRVGLSASDATFSMEAYKTNVLIW